MTGRHLRVLLVEHDRGSESALARTLIQRGHRVDLTWDPGEAITLPPPDVLVVDVGDSGVAGLLALEQLRLRGESVRAVVLSGLPSLEVCRRALQLGANEFLARPFGAEDLIRAVEDEGSPHVRRSSRNYSRTYEATAEAVEVGTRDLAAYALRCGVGPTARARIASCCAEALDNVRRHAYAEVPGQVRVSAEADTREIVVTIRDEGRGFDSFATGLDQMGACLDGGLARISALAEDLVVDSASGSGTTLRMRFATSRVQFDEEVLDLSELDWFTPDTARMVLEVLSDPDRGDPFHLSPALAVTLGRLLAGPDPRRVLQTALWS